MFSFLFPDNLAVKNDTEIDVAAGKLIIHCVCRILDFNVILVWVWLVQLNGLGGAPVWNSLSLHVIRAMRV